MVLLPFACLAVFLTLLVSAFVRDKVTFVYEWNQLQSRYLSSQIDLIMARLKNNPDEALFKVHLAATFDKATDIRGAIKKEQAIEVAQSYGVALCSNVRNLSWIHLGERLLYGYCIKAGDGFDLYGVSRSRINDLFSERGLSDTILVGQDGYILAGPSEYPVGRELKSLMGSGVDPIFNSLDLPQGRLELFNQKDRVKYLVHFYRIPDEAMLIVSLTPRSAPQRAALLFVYKGILFGVGLLLVAIFAGLFISSAILKNVMQLRQAMVDFGQGSLDTHLQVTSRDEIGQMAKAFNQMVDQIKQLMKVHEEKTKVDAEMALAADLQKKFFPEAHYQSTHFQFNGFYEPANRCGGDWWTYTDTADHFIVCIGDVTGHGLPAALLTSAARAVVAEFKNKFEGPAKSMEIMNRAIFETSAGTLNMTCLIAAFDKKSGTMTYSNASHEPTYFFTPHSELKRKEIEALDEVHGPRLGERYESCFGESRLECQPHSLFLFYSDGLKDLVNPENEMFEEKRLLRLLTTMQDPNVSATEALNLVKEKASEWRQGMPLVDDLSYFILKI
jgi:sigma-B regulation protein RsbU (phosphoserine phosphatase)